MKNLLFAAMALVLFAFNGNAQDNVKEWKSMMETYKEGVNSVLITECPKDMQLDDFKQSIIHGKLTISKNSLSKLSILSEPLKKYGNDFAKKNKLRLTDEASLIFYSSFSPDLDIENGDLLLTTNGITGADIVNCALTALGADALYSLAFSGASSWSIAALTTTFTNVAKRFIGPIGVAIAVVSFGLCLHQAYIN